MANTLDKNKWKEEHLQKMHEENYDWCPLCVARKDGEGKKGEEVSINVSENMKMKSSLV